MGKTASRKGQDKGYKITENEKGIYLTVWPAELGAQPATEASILQELQKRDYFSFELSEITKALEMSLGEPLRIGEFAPTPEILPEITVMVRRDRLEAMIQVTIPDGGVAVKKEQLLDKLKLAGVVLGIDETVLEWLVRTRSSMNMLCAQGVPSQPGENAYLKYHVDLEGQGRPVEQEDGSVDFKDINNFISVEEGQLLVEKIPHTLGISGHDVLGLEIVGKPGKDIPMPFGKNVLPVDNSRLVSAISGQLHMKNDRIHVLPVLEVQGDVDYSTGNIDFVGSVVVHGNLQTDFMIKAIGNVEIRGNIFGGSVEAMSLIVRRGIQGMNRSDIKVKERVVSQFIENAKVCADQDIVVQNVIHNSFIFAGIRVIVEGGRGLVIGGRISAGEEIRLTSAGNQAHVATTLEVASNPFVKEELITLRQKSKVQETTYGELEKTQSYLCKQGLVQLAPDKRARYNGVQGELEILSEEIQETKERILDLEKLLKELKPGRIRISNTVFPGVIISVGLLSKTMHDALQYISFYAQEGEIRFSSFR